MSGVLAAMAHGGVGDIQNISNGTDATGVTLSLATDGSYSMTGTAGGNWVVPASAVVAAYYEVKVDPTSGAFTSGDTTGAWLAMTSIRGWIEDSGTVTFDISWRDAATQTVRKVQTGVTMEKI